MRKSIKMLTAAVLTVGITTTGGIQVYKNFEELKKENKQLNKEINSNEKVMNIQDSEIRALITENNKLIDKNAEFVKVINSKDKSIKKLKTELDKSKSEAKKVRQVSRGTTQTSGKTEVYQVTAYHADHESTGKHKGDKGYGITASGTTVQEGRTIACPPELKFGTKVHIDTVGYRVCEDRGGAIKGKILDLYISDRDRVWEFGRKRLNVTILN